MSKDGRIVQNTYEVQYHPENVVAEITAETNDVMYSASGRLTVKHEDGGVIFGLRMPGFPVDDVDQESLFDSAVDCALVYMDIEVLKTEKAITKNRTLLRRTKAFSYTVAGALTTFATMLPIAYDEMRDAQGVVTSGAVGFTGVSFGVIAHFIAKQDELSQKKDTNQLNHTKAIRYILEMAQTE